MKKAWRYSKVTALTLEGQHGIKLGIKLGIVTSDSKESTEKTINYFEWNDLFQVIIGRESTPYTKESGEPTKLAVKELNANPNTTLMIGDAPMDYISAKNAGI